VYDYGQAKDAHAGVYGEFFVITCHLDHIAELGLGRDKPDDKGGNAEEDETSGNMGARNDYGEFRAVQKKRLGNTSYIQVAEAGFQDIKAYAKKYRVEHE
jgi:hypothetical protein